MRKTLTPQLRTDKGETKLILIDLGNGKTVSADRHWLRFIPSQATIRPIWKARKNSTLFDAIQTLNGSGLLLAYHDRSDGGLFVTLCEMAFAGHCGITLALDSLISLSAEPDDDRDGQVLSTLFNEELGAVIQIEARHHDAVMTILADAGLGHISHTIGSPNRQDDITLMVDGGIVFQEKCVALQRIWSETSFRMQNCAIIPNVHSRSSIRFWTWTIRGCMHN